MVLVMVVLMIMLTMNMYIFVNAQYRSWDILSPIQWLKSPISENSHCTDVYGVKGRDIPPPIQQLFFIWRGITL